MADSKKSKYDRRLYVFVAIYLAFCAFMFPGSDPMFVVRYGGFFLLTQLLIQVIFPQFRSSKSANLIAASIVMIGVILISLA